MQFLKKIILSTVSLFTLSTLALFSSCAPKNSCDTLVCKNGGTCAADFCNCPTGYDGPECQNKITDRFIGSYAGMTLPKDGQPHRYDTVDVYLSSNPLTLSLARRRRPDLIYTGVIQNQNNTIVINDLIKGTERHVVNASLKSPTSIDPSKVLSLDVVEYMEGKKVNELQFNGKFIYN